MPNRFACIALLLASALVLSACKDSASTATGSSATPASQPVSVGAIAAEARGFSVGSEMNIRKIFVFFDPQCPHCAEQWEWAKPLKSQARFIWVPVAFMNANSPLQGAAILGAADPAAAMEAHEVSMRAKQGGITGGEKFEAQKSLVLANTKLANSFSFNSIPVLVGTHATTGDLVVNEGAMNTLALATAFGLQTP